MCVREQRGGAETGIRLHVGNVDQNRRQVDLALNGERVVVAAAGLLVRTAEHLQHVFMRLTLQLAEHVLQNQTNMIVFWGMKSNMRCRAKYG